MDNLRKYIESKKKVCFHYRSPVHCESCAKGVNYREHVGGERRGYLARLPCVTTSISYDQVKCDKFRAYTEKESKDEYEKFKQMEKELFNVTRDRF